MGYYNIYTSEKQTKKTFQILNNEQGENKFEDELQRMAKNAIYYLLYMEFLKTLYLWFWRLQKIIQFMT